MKKTKIVSLCLSLSLLSFLAIPSTWALPSKVSSEQENSSMVISKTAHANNNGDYTITLEAYATGDKIISQAKKDIPADIILVLDQSGSMTDPMSSYKSFFPYTNATNTYLYEYRFNNDSFLPNTNLYYPLDGGYVEIQVDKNLSNRYDYHVLSSETSNSIYYDYANLDNLFIKDPNGQYQKVTVSESRFTYTYSVNGQQIAQSIFSFSVPDFGSYGPLYAYEQIYEYTYYYQLAGQGRVNIETSFGDDTVPNEIYYYQNGTVTISRLEALRSSVTTFTNSVAKKAAGPDGILGNDDDVNHRVAIVGFASEDGYGDNTELLSISGKNSGSVGVKYDKITNQHLIDVLQDMDTLNGKTMVENAINALDAEGATQCDLGMDMANRILNANPVPAGEKRSRVVVFFTDGSPTSSRDYEEKVANATIEKANSIKNKGASIYSVGIFPGADATENGIDLGNKSHLENQFMQDVSSNNGTPKNPSYYLSAADTDALNNIFQQISNQIEQGGSSTTLNEETVIKDIIAPEFTLPNGANASNIVLETYSYTGENQWEPNNDSMGAYATVNGDKVDVTGFNFSENYVGTVTNNGNVTYRGDKLVITFNVQTKDGFLGGNNIYTNTSANIYENSSSDKPILTFERPQVNVPIPSVNVTANDKNVYLLSNLTADEIRSGTTVKVGDVELNLDPVVDNYGLQPWQTSGVDISVVITDANGNVINTDLTNLSDSTTYNVAVQVSPKSTALSTSSGAEAVTQSVNKKGAINVFKPELTYKDSDVYYGADAPTDFTKNLIDTKWKHNDTEANTATMGEAPELTLTHTPDVTKFANGKINTKQNVDVNAEVKIGENIVTNDTTFIHTDCIDTDCNWTNPTTAGTPAFLLHIKTCQLTIKKSGGAFDEPYVFTVYKDGSPYSEISIVGNNSETIYELPVGTYTIVEDAGWSWRYDSNNGDMVKLTTDTPTGSITCNNTKTDIYWLNGFSSVVKNIFGVAK